MKLKKAFVRIFLYGGYEVDRLDALLNEEDRLLDKVEFVTDAVDSWRLNISKSGPCWETDKDHLTATSNAFVKEISEFYNRVEAEVRFVSSCVRSWKLSNEIGELYQLMDELYELLLVVRDSWIEF